MPIRVFLVGLLLGLAAVGCGTGSSPLASAAAKDVRERSQNAGYVMSRVPRASPVVDRARKVVGDTGVARIELLEAEGTGIAGHLLLRISVSIAGQGFSSGSSATGCFRYDMTDRSGGSDPHEVSCPSTAPITLPEPTPEPTMPPDALERLEAALRAKDPAAAAVRAFAGTRTVVGTDVSGGVVGVSVLAGRDHCLFGRRQADGTVEVWVVPRVVAQPGELGCAAEFATRGEGKTSPH